MAQSNSVAPQAPQDQALIAKLAQYEFRLKEKDLEIDTYKLLVAKLEEQVEKAQKQLTKWTKDAEGIEQLKNESEQTLTKAKSIIFERTKAYSQQIESLKDVVRITKDLLEIRNLETKQLETKINCMEEKHNAEKERQQLMHKKLETMIRHNGELKREYEAQLCLFSALRERYNERELAREVVDNMKEDIKKDKEAAGVAVVNGVEKEEGDKPGPSSKPDEPLLYQNGAVEQQIYSFYYYN
ncbi:hypothetical protein NQ317_005255 [Molorchus minor]|uniref:Uncharacterized protein n=1 Tax=Molorchus minor TaxID=1323400 RepID=A0ABQ9K0A4_9CUCU|nr:hypothetical protein NQ317_005255 [Molorchus minor]